MNRHKILAGFFYPAFMNLVWQLPKRKKVLYLTFDDGPFPPATGEILRILDEHRVPATFFLSGNMIFRYRHQLHTLNYRNHRLGNHGFFHFPLFGISRKRIRRELWLTDRLIMKYFGKTTSLFRPPFGILGPAVNKVIHSLEKDLILWSLMSNDFKWPAQRVREHLINNLESGDIVVFHDSPRSHQTTLQVLPDFLSYCREEGYEFLVL